MKLLVNKSNSAHMAILFRILLINMEQPCINVKNKIKFWQIKK